MADERDDTERQQVDGEQPAVSEQEASGAAGDAPATPPAVEEGPPDSPGVQEGPAADAPPIDDGPPSPVGQRSPLGAQAAAEGEHSVAHEHPEYFIGGAFVGGLVIAQVLKRVGNG